MTRSDRPSWCSSSDEKRAALLALLKQLSYSQRDVTLASGQAAQFYIDGKQTPLHPTGNRLCGELLYELIVDWDVDAVGGPTLGADPLAVAVMYAAHRAGVDLPAFIVRKEAKSHGTSAWIEGATNLPAGGRLAFVEDVVTTGGSVLRAIERARDEGFHVVGVVCLVARNPELTERFAAAGLSFRSLFDAEDFS